MSKFKAFIGKLIRKILFNEKSHNKFFYGKYQGGKKLSLIKRFLIPLLDIHSLIDYIFFHNNKLILKTIGKSKEINENFLLNSNERKILDELKKNGIVFLDKYYEKIADQLIHENLNEGMLSHTRTGYIRNNNLKQSTSFFKILNDKSLIKIASNYYGVKSFFRYRPNVNLTYPDREDVTSTEKFMNSKNEYGNFADDWHVDSIYNLQFHILLKDTSSSDTRMLFAKGKKVSFFERFCLYASEEYVKNNFEIVELVGKKGTVIIFDGSVHWHRLFPVKDKKRYTSSVLFTRGQQVCDPKIYNEKLLIDKLNHEMLEPSKFIY